ncbi:hypothetical protein RYH80_08125 [Halobaculum sp. MBLA0147]|uniref:hypothetical protein n=1 Tax=Halobaculum sp. MBLA0147 TaxID=3079934 RepID=UPI0035240AC7
MRRPPRPGSTRTDDGRPPTDTRGRLRGSLALLALLGLAVAVASAPAVTALVLVTGLAVTAVGRRLRDRGRFRPAPRRVCIPGTDTCVTL